MLLELIEIGRFDIHDLLSESVDLAGNSPPEYLIEHGVSHVIVASSLLVLGNGKGVLRCLATVTLQNLHDMLTGYARVRVQGICSGE